MAVAKSQITEILLVLVRHLPHEKVRAVLLDLKETEAYRRNHSFATTVNRLLENQYSA